MLRKILIIILILVLQNISEAQISSRNGWCFTPRDSIKILLVYVGFGSNEIDEPSLNNTWAIGQKYPNVVYTNELFYTDFGMFDSTIKEERDINNISRWYYEQSKLSGIPLKMIANAVRVDIDYITKKDYIANYFINNRRKNL